MSKTKSNSKTCQLNSTVPIHTQTALFAAPFEERVGGAQNPIDDVEIPALEAIHHFCQQVWPLLREVFPPNNTDGIT